MFGHSEPRNGCRSAIPEAEGGERLEVLLISPPSGFLPNAAEASLCRLGQESEEEEEAPVAELFVVRSRGVLAGRQVDVVVEAEERDCQEVDEEAQGEEVEAKGEEVVAREALVKPEADERIGAGKRLVSVLWAARQRATTRV